MYRYFLFIPFAVIAFVAMKFSFFNGKLELPPKYGQLQEWPQLFLKDISFSKTDVTISPMSETEKLKTLDHHALWLARYPQAAQRIVSDIVATLNMDGSSSEMQEPFVMGMEMEQMSSRDLGLSDSSFTDTPDEVRRWIKNTLLAKLAQIFFDEEKHHAARFCIDEMIMDSKETQMMVSALNEIEQFDEALFAFGRGQVKKAIALLEDLDHPEAPSLKKMIKVVLVGIEKADDLVESLKFDEATKKLLELQDKIAKPKHYYYGLVTKKLKKINRENILKSLIEHGRKSMLAGEYDQTRLIYQHIGKYDEAVAKELMDEMNEYPSQLFKKTNEMTKTRPLVAYYALKEVQKMVGPKSKYASQLNIKIMRLKNMINKSPKKILALTR